MPKYQITITSFSTQSSIRAPAMPYLFISFVTLIVLCVTHHLRCRYKSPSVSFTYWWHMHQLSLWCVLAVALFQSHLGCSRLWSECYVENYPEWFALVKTPMLATLGIWTLCASLMVCKNLRLIYFGWTTSRTDHANKV